MNGTSSAPPFSTRQLGASGLTVSALGVGTNKWRYGENDEQVYQAFQASLDAGINFFDTAEIYGFGKSERLLGECIRQSGCRVVVASKFAPIPGHRLDRALEGSLTRLGLPSIDLYYIHVPIGNIDVLMDDMARLFEQGLIRSVGVSNFSAAQMSRAAERLGRHNIPLAANQVQYHLLHRQPETDGVLEACRELDVALVAYLPLAGGWRNPGHHAPLRSLSSASMNGFSQLLETLEEIARKRGKSANQVMLNWLLCRDEHILPIPGTRREEHALSNAASLTWRLEEDEFAAIDRASGS